MNSLSLPSPPRPLAGPRLLLVAVLALLMSACTMRALVSVTVNPDGSGVFEISMAFDEELRTLMEQESDEPIDWSDPGAFEGEDSPADMLGDLPDTASITAYSEDDFEGFTVSVDFSSLEELNEVLSEESEEDEEAFPFEITEPEDGRFELTTHGEVFGETDTTGDEFEMIPQSMLEDLFDMQLHVRLPGEVLSTNADETTDDGVMVWQLNPLAEEQVRPEAVSEVSSSSTTAIFVVLAVLAIGAVVGVVVLLRRGSADEDPPAVPVVPADGSEGPA